jgi:drug/metabolite transporter (DMT)-like permease
MALLVAGLGWAIGSLWARYGAHHPHTGVASAQQMIAGGIALLLIGVARGEAARAARGAISGESALAFAYLLVFGSLVAFSAFGWLVVVSTPARLSTASYVNPVVAVILGWLILGESLGRRALAGAALIVAAVVVMTVGGGSLRAVARRRSRAAAARGREIDASGAGG